MLSLVTFGTGYLMRPLGAIVLGAYIDHHGRRKGLLLTLALMAVGTLSIGMHARIRDDRAVRAAAGGGGTFGARLLGGRRNRRRQRVSGRNRDPRAAKDFT